MISSIAWVRRGAAARVPTTEAGLHEVMAGQAPAEPAMAAASSSSSQRGKAAGKRRSAEDEADEEDDDEEATPVLTAGNIMYYRSNKEDPNITINEDEDIDSEIDDYEITETDLVLLGARSDEQLSNLEVYIYEEPVDNLYPHHDIPLPVFPLCVAWLDHHPAAAAGASSSTSRPRGNYAAVGTFAPYIEIWDLDVIDALEPVCVLGAEAAAAAADSQFTSAAAEALAASERQKGSKKDGAAGEGAAGKKPKRKKKLGGASGGPQGHTDAVMCLSWNTLKPNLLASGSADATVRLWDLDGDVGGSTMALTQHTDKVQALAWHPTEAAGLLSAGFDKRAIAVDVRAPAGPTAREWQLTADAERVRWSPGGMSFVVSSEDGLVKCFDIRHSGGGASGGAVWSLQAHSGATAALDFCPAASDILATGGQDKLVKVWSVSGAKPEIVGRRNMGLGAIFDVSFASDSPTLLGAGGASGKLGVWNTLELEAMQERFPTAVAALDEDGRVLSNAVAGMGALDVNSSDEDDDDDDGREHYGGNAIVRGEVGAAAAASSAGRATSAKGGGARDSGMSANGGGGMSSGKAAAGSKGKAVARDVEMDDEEDEDEEEDEEDEEDEAVAPAVLEQTARESEAAAHRARVEAALAAAAKKARRGKPKNKAKAAKKGR